MSTRARDSSESDKKIITASATVASSSPTGSNDPEAIAFAKCRGNALVYGRRGVILARNADGTYKVQILDGNKKKKKKTTKKSNKASETSECEVQERVQRRRLHWRFSLARQADVAHVNGE